MNMKSRWLDSVGKDLRYAFRSLRRDAGFATFAILIVGLGIGASSTLFSVVNALLLRPLPFHDPQRLVWITNYDVAGLSGQTTQVMHLVDLREQNHSFADMAGYFAFYGVGDKVLGGQTPERLSSVPVSCNFFPMLGLEPDSGPPVHCRRMQMARSESSAAEPRILGAALRLRPVDRRPPADHRQRSRHGGRRAAGVVRFLVDLRSRQSYRSVRAVPADGGDQSLGQHHGDRRPAEARVSRPAARRRKSGCWPATSRRRIPNATTSKAM